eukprot:CAMPEP_0176413816 /NCGR_PEP_ID=MMETSP0127-20121128/4908_1 /TAXON_ID=938130 /ORGANISM="Platyophrya macrostoma, Strain WH" /LENGTH=690 /DNA_ID=CAMNT_0017793637 /DNA_START=31 /DNA_END=2104 /DNA_ORIENTATION=-
MLRSQTELSLAKLLREISRVEVASEHNRVSLNNNPEFDSYAAFYTLDSLQSGYLKPTDLYAFLTTNKVSCTYSDLDLLFNVYDKNRDGLLSYSEFLNLILPADIEQDDLQSENRTFPRHILRGLRLINELQLELVESYDWNPKDAYHAIDVGNFGYIDRISLGSFFRRNGLTTDRDEVNGLVRRLDKDYDGKISYYEFLSIFSIQGTRSSPRGSPRLSPRLSPRMSQSHGFSAQYGSPRRSSRSRSPPESETRHRQHTDELIKQILLKRAESPVSSPRSRVNMDRINEMVDNCLKKSIENRIRSIHGSPARPRSRDSHHERYATIYDDDKGRRPGSPSRSTGFDSTKFSRTGDNYGREKIAQRDIDDLVDRALRKSRELRSRSASPKRYEPERKYPVSDSKYRDDRYSKPAEPITRTSDIKAEEANQANGDNYQTPKKDAQAEVSGTEQKNAENSEQKSIDLQSQMKLTPMKGQEEHILVKAIQEIIQLDQAIEDLRENLVHQRDFTPLLAYHTFFDQESANSCSMRKLIEVLTAAKAQLSEKDHQLIFQRFDRDQDGNLSEKDFEEVVYPKDRKLAKELASRAIGAELSAETKELVNEFLRQVVATEKKIEEIRKRLSKRSLFDIEEAFRVLDSNQEGAITEEGFQILLEKYNVNASNKQLENLIQRFDNDFDGKINLNEFYRGLVPSN